ncbi:MAG: rhodanese-related sulfurtransferase [Natronomonas sp.]|jgi:rhodanese-related sulfurtransferase
MDRRTFLRTGLAAGAAATAGCFGGEPPEAANEYGYETTSTDDGVEVPLVPIDDAIEWYREDDGPVFADARSPTAYQRAHIADAVLSPAPDGRDDGDPLADRSTDTRIVTYCGCPHHLSAMRGGTLIENGYVHTYAIDEGFNAWIDAGYPLAGQAVEQRPDVYEIHGRTDAAHAGEYAWARHDPTGQREAVPIAEDGTFDLELRFYDIDRDSDIRLTTPAAEIVQPLGQLLGSIVRL